MDQSSTSKRFHKTLALLAVLATAWSVYEGWALSGLSRQLQAASTSPRAMTSLVLAPSTAEARRIRLDWNATRSTRDPDQRRLQDERITDVAIDALDRDSSRYIPSYVAALVLLGLWGTRTASKSRVLAGVIVVLILAAGVADVIENRLLRITLLASLDADVGHLVTLARLAAMTKFVCLLFGAAGVLAAVGGALNRLLNAGANDRSQCAALPITKVPLRCLAPRGFAKLICLENEGIFADSRMRSKDEPLVVDHIAADEPRVLFRAADVVGLALSGGGIRSATFNLGLLQGLQRLGVLKLFDYLSTVSGGGYVGAFWSEWLARPLNPPSTPGPAKPLFPTFVESGSSQQSRVDTDQERHLREFSGFLAPRWGFFEVETWSAVVAVLAGLIPALLIGLSVIGTILIGWLALTFSIASPSNYAAPLVITLVTIATFWGFEAMWLEFKSESAGQAAKATPGTPTPLGRLWYFWIAAAAVALVGFIQWRVASWYVDRSAGPWPIYRSVSVGAWLPASTDSGLLRWWDVVGVAKPEHAWLFSPRLFDFSLAWLIAAGVLVMVRVSYAVTPWNRTALASFDRVLMRVLGLAVSWLTIASLWHISINLDRLVATAIASMVSAGIFASLRNWIGMALRRPTDGGLGERLKPLVPPLLAYLTIALTAIVTGGVLIQLGHVDWFTWYLLAAVMLLFVLLALFIRTDHFGLHAFYRERISRAYTGACNIAAGQHANDNRDAETKTGDDRPIDSLVDRPLHLVCCAANDLSGDQVETLDRGARSAVLSKHGFSVGTHFDCWATGEAPLLGSAITASAAAFNSAMGQISIRLGPAVSFLMTMLNLRLGLWVRHPAAPAAQPRRWPGILLYREMFALTSASGRVPPGGSPRASLRDLHLSDGAHFENLALYELIRRHCRYVLVSDCGADPNVAFDDLGNALRRIREDFGVEISLDVSSLRPGTEVERRSRQHVAVGTIHYSATDHGILLYVKPSITGDEPTDVLQYRTRNTAFPHESTGDQFYDEAQWESYRRLGLHAAEQVFDFVARDDARTPTADWVFAEARHHWGDTPEGLESSVLEMTKRFGVLEAELAQRGATGILTQLYPEMEHLPQLSAASEDEATEVNATEVKATEVKAAEDKKKAALGAADSQAATATEVATLMRLVQLMEDTWLTCELDRWWSHPLNLGWINLFARWAAAPSFRFWWPFVSPMFTPGFRRFIEERFPMPPGDGHVPTFGEDSPIPQKGIVKEVKEADWQGLAGMWWQKTPGIVPTWFGQAPSAERTVYQHIIYLKPKTGVPVPMQVGLVGVTRRGTHAGWSSDDYFVPPSLWGASMGWYLLDQVLHKLAEAHSHCYVVVKAPPTSASHQVAKDDRRSFIEQYRKIGFRQALGSVATLKEQFGDGYAEHVVTVSGDAFPMDDALATTLGYDDRRDTLLALDLTQWRRHQ